MWHADVSGDYASGCSSESRSVTLSVSAGLDVFVALTFRSRRAKPSRSVTYKWRGRDGPVYVEISSIRADQEAILRTFMNVRGMKPALAVIATVLVVLAGKSGNPASAGSITSTLSTGGTTWAHSNGKAVSYKGARPKAQFFRVGLPSGEPTIAITKNGDLFFPSIDVSSNPPNHVEVLKSSDKGKSWKIVSPMIGNANSHPVSLDPYVWVDPDTNRVFNIDLTVACSLMSFTDDEGETWTTNPLACGRPVNDHQTLFGGPPATSTPVGYPSVLYYCWNDVASSSCSKSIDGGLTFSPTGSPSFTGVQPSAAGDGDPPPFCGGLHGHGVVGRDGTVYIPKESCEQPWLGISKDEGLTWETMRVSPKSAGPNILDPSVDTDDKGNIYYAWTGGDRNVYLTTSTDGGVTWSKAAKVNPPGVHESNLATLDASPSGKVAISFMGSENTKWRANCEKKNNCPASGDYAETTWNGYVTTTTNPLADRPLFLSTRVNSPKDPIARGQCGPGRCGLVFDFIDVMIGHDGTPYTTFVDVCIEVCALPTGRGNYGADGVVVRLVGGPSLR